MKYVTCPKCGSKCAIQREPDEDPNGSWYSTSWAECESCGYEIESPEIYRLKWTEEKTVQTRPTGI